MPILAPEPDLYPEDLLEQVQTSVQDGLTWWALYCLPRQEKQLMRRLRNNGVAHYCPLIAKRNHSPSGRIRVSYVPLFPGYAFVYGCATDRYTAVSTGCVSRCLEVSDSDVLRHDLKQIHHLVTSGAALTWESRLSCGAKVRVTSGPFLGLEGVIVRRQSKTLLIVAVNYLQQGASLVLHDCQVESIE